MSHKACIHLLCSFIWSEEDTAIAEKIGCKREGETTLVDGDPLTSEEDGMH